MINQGVNGLEFAMNKWRRMGGYLKAFFMLLIAAFMATPGVRADGWTPDQDSRQAYSADDTVFIPHAYGKTIYRCNEESPNQVYIIGMSHRDSVTRANGDTTVMSQMDVYRISEWLIKNHGLELLLPEGFFLQDSDATSRPDMPLLAQSIHAAEIVDNATLKDRLQDDMVYVNAEILLMQRQGIRARQIEDNDLYHAVQTEIITLEKSRTDAFAYVFEKAKLQYLQERRTAAMLQKIPDIVNEEFLNGSISNRKAIFTVGLNHVPGIINYLEENRIAIYSPAFVQAFSDYVSGVKLLDETYGITIIIPRSLADSRDIMRLTRLEQML